MPIVLNGSTGITTEGMNVDTIVDTAGTGGPSLPNNIVEMDFVDVLGDITNLETNKLDKDQNIVLGTSVPASGTAVDFVGIPDGVKRITVMFDGVSTNGTSPFIVQLGTSAGVENSGYVGGGTALVDSTANTTGFAIRVVTAGNLISVPMSILKTSGNSYIASHAGWRTGVNVGLYGGGSKTLSGTLDRIRITTVNGTDTFGAGTINISWEF